MTSSLVQRWHLAFLSVMLNREVKRLDIKPFGLNQLL
jgi:hypothetical protein